MANTPYDEDEQVFQSRISDIALDKLIQGAGGDSDSGSLADVLDEIKQSDDFTQTEIADYDIALNRVMSEMMKKDLSISYFDFFTAVDKVLIKIHKKRAATAGNAQRQTSQEAPLPYTAALYVTSTTTQSAAAISSLNKRV